MTPARAGVDEGLVRSVLALVGNGEGATFTEVRRGHPEVRLTVMRAVIAHLVDSGHLVALPCGATARYRTVPEMLEAEVRLEVWPVLSQRLGAGPMLLGEVARVCGLTLLAAEHTVRWLQRDGALQLTPVGATLVVRLPQGTFAWTVSRQTVANAS